MMPNKALLHNLLQQLSAIRPKSMSFGNVAIECTHPK